MKPSFFRASFLTKTLHVDDHSFKFQIWDTAGQEKVSEVKATFPFFSRTQQPVRFIKKSWYICSEDIIFNGTIRKKMHVFLLGDGRSTVNGYVTIYMKLWYIPALKQFLLHNNHRGPVRHQIPSMFVTYL